LLDCTSWQHKDQPLHLYWANCSVSVGPLGLVWERGVWAFATRVLGSKLLMSVI